MQSQTRTVHIALECMDRGKAEIFFTKILEIPKVKSFTLSGDLSDSIFGIQGSVEIDFYTDGLNGFEVFGGSKPREKGYGHTCVEVESSKAFISRCRQYGIEPNVVKKDGKDLLFVRDFSDNLFEVKEKAVS